MGDARLATAGAQANGEQSETSSAERVPKVPNDEPPKKGGLEGQVIPQLSQSQRSGLNRRPLDYESSALPLSYAGECRVRPSYDDRTACPGTDSNRDALRHHPLKMACLPISPPGPFHLLYQLSVISYLNSRISLNSQSLSLGAVQHGSDGARTRDLSSDSRVL